MKPVPMLALALLAPVAAAPQKQQLELRVAQGTVLRKSFKNRMALEAESVALSINGRRVPGESLGKFELHVAEEMQAVVRDGYEAVVGGVPMRLRRTFEQLSGEGRRSSRTEAGENEDRLVRSSALEGRSVLFEQDAASSAWKPEFAGERDADADAELLAGLEFELDYTEFLPPHPVAVGDQWQLDPSLFERLVNPGGDLALVPIDGAAEEDDETRMMNDLLAKNRSGSLTATYRGLRRIAGTEVAVVDLACKLWSDGECEDRGDAPTTTNLAMSFDLFGQLTWDIAAGHFHTLDVSGKIGMLVTLHGDTEPEEGPRVTTRQSLDFIGTMSLYAEVLR
jgi:hypothetical protein